MSSHGGYVRSTLFSTNSPRCFEPNCTIKAGEQQGLVQHVGAVPFGEAVQVTEVVLSSEVIPHATTSLARLEVVVTKTREHWSAG